MKRTWFAGPYLFWMVLFTIVPILIVAYFAFSKDGGFTIGNFVKFFDPIYFGVFLRSVWMALACTVICFLIGYPAALFLTSRDFSNTGAMVVLLVVPMWMNFLLRTYAWMSLLEDTGIINSFLASHGMPTFQFLYNETAVLMGMVYNFLPFMILPLYSVLKKLDTRVIEAAEDLGANAFMVFIRVKFPLSLPGVVSGFTMVFMPAITTFVISRLLGGSRYMLFGDLIERQFLEVGNWGVGSALSLLMMILILLSMNLLNSFEQKYTKTENGGDAW